MSELLHYSPGREPTSQLEPLPTAELTVIPTPAEIINISLPATPIGSPELSKREKLTAARSHARQLSVIHTGVSELITSKINKTPESREEGWRDRKKLNSILTKDATAAMFELFEIRNLPPEQKTERMQAFNRIWLDRADEFEELMVKLNDELENVDKEPAVTQNKPLIAAMKRGFDAAREKIQPKKENEQATHTEDWKAFAGDMAEILTNRKLPYDKRLELLEMAGFSKEEAKRKLLGIGIAAGVTAITLAVAEPAGIAAAGFGATQHFFDSFPDKKGTAAALAFRVGYYSICYAKARANLRMNKQSGLGVSAAGTVAFHVLDGHVSDTTRDKAAIGSEMAFDALPELPYMLAMFAPEIGTSASVAADTFGMGITGALAVGGLMADKAVTTYRASKEIKDSTKDRTENLIFSHSKATS